MDTGNLNVKRMYETGLRLEEAGNLVDAISYFNSIKQDEEYKKQTLLKLFKIYIRLSNYSKCRCILNELKPLMDTRYYEAQLDLWELNYKTSLDFYRKQFDSGKNQYEAFLTIADIYSYFGYLDVARKMYETVLINQKYYISAMYRIFGLDLLLKDYKRIKKVFENDERIQINDKNISYFLVAEYFLGKRVRKNTRGNYILDLLNSEDDKILIRHIERHKCKCQNGLGVFYKDVSISSLINEVRERIKNINSISMGSADIYKFSLDKYIGIYDGRDTKDVGVNVITGTDKIITIYPISLSCEFNREGLLENKELLLRRGK